MTPTTRSTGRKATFRRRVRGTFAHKQWASRSPRTRSGRRSPLGTPPEVAGGILASAVEEISAATGLAFRVGGTTDE
ncbi:MAG TPA: hypothetical protein VFJ83_06835 [Nocardioidaceae bacterium]|nr:hypothetical protein [Nocardioidaceae bacterium]